MNFLDSPIQMGNYEQKDTRPFKQRYKGLEWILKARFCCRLSNTE